MFFLFWLHFNFNFNKIKWNIFTVAPGFYSILFVVRETFEFFECGEPKATLMLISPHFGTEVDSILIDEVREYPTGNLRVSRNPTLPQKG